MILVLLGTQNNSFHRLLEEIQKCIDTKTIKEEVIVQAGSTKQDFTSKDMEIFDLIPARKLRQLEKEANYIITHGGVGSIVECLKLGKKIIAVPRYHRYEEHVNDHQLEIVQTFDGQGFVKGIKEVEELENTIQILQEFEPNEFKSNTKKLISIVGDFIEKN